jgi:glycosyltransferase involved in cell wall biosynthesis
MASPGVSVVIPAYNAASTLARALDSVVAQTRPASEVIVVDDASMDSTAEVANGYAHATIKLVRLASNSGAAAARNKGVETATAELVAFLDADDEWLPTKLEKQVAVISSDRAMSFVSCESKLMSSAGADLGDIYGGHEIVSGQSAWKALLKDNFVTTPSVLVWRQLFEKLGGFNPLLKIAEDQDMWIRLAEAGSLGYVAECLVVVHERRSSLSSGAFSDQLRYTLPMIEGHIERLRDRLSEAEITSIRGRRLQRLGQLAFSRGEPRIGRKLVVRSVAMGYRPWEGLTYLAKANPMAAWIKNRLPPR